MAFSSILWCLWWTSPHKARSHPSVRRVHGTRIGEGSWSTGRGIGHAHRAVQRTVQSAKVSRWTSYNNDKTDGIWKVTIGN